MADFKQAIEWMREGKKVKATTNNSIKGPYWADGFKMKCDFNGEDLIIYDFLGWFVEPETNWEIYEEQSLSDDRIFVGNNCEKKYSYSEDDVKEFISTIKSKTQVGTEWYRLGFHKFIEELAGDKLC